MLENELFWRRNFVHEQGSVRALVPLIRQARAFIDIGANTGFYALLAKSSNPWIEVIAVEPSPANFRALEHNIELNSFHVTALEAAVTDHDGEVTLHDFPSLSYSASLEGSWRDGTTERRVTGCTLDSIAARFGIEGPDVMVKVDVEGHEAAVLRGAARTIESGAQFMIEVIRDKIAKEIAELLPPVRHRYRFIDERSGALVDMSSRLADSKQIPLGNYLIEAALPQTISVAAAVPSAVP